MGYKCPVCLNDFGRDKAKWSEHIKTTHFGCGNDIVKAVEKIAEVVNEEKNEEI